MTLGLILAGGRSRRFGAEKAAALLGGISLLARAHARLTADCASVAVNSPAGCAAADLAARLGAPLVEDPPSPVAGPLVGVLAGLGWARARGETTLITSPCDAPFLPDDMAARLIAALGEASAAVARSPDGLQPLCAIWSTSLIDPLAAVLAGGRHPPVHAFLTAVGAVHAPFGEAGAFANLNTPQDLAEAERRLSGA